VHGTGDAEARRDFETLFAAHAAAVHRLLVRLCRNRADADDLLQETFLAVWRKRDQFEARGSVEGWIRKTAFRTYLNERGKRRRRDALDEKVPRPAESCAPPADGEVAHREAVAILAARAEEALAEVPDEPREAFVLFRFEGMTCAEIGELTGVPAKTAETRVRRATEILAARLAPWRHVLQDGRPVR
jgi:RNA polymerase sigma-70 factor (ECF subfamily)